MVRQTDSLPVRNYTFRLQDSPPLNASPEHYSRHGDTIIYKEKIDSLFREKHSSTPNSEVSVTSSHIDASVEHLRSHFQKAMKEPRTPNTPLTPSSAPETNNASQGKTMGKTVVVVKPGGVAVNSQNAHRSKPMERAPSFIKARTAVQAQIEKMFSDATKASEDGNQSTSSTTISSITVTGSSSTSSAKIPARNELHAPDRSNQSVLPPAPPSMVAASTPLDRKSPSDIASMVTSPSPSASIPNNTNFQKSLPPAPLTPSPPSPSADTAPLATPKLVDVKYAVDYLGSVVLQERATNLEALQIPLKDLYFRYRSMLRQGHTDYEATLDISANGLRIQPFKDTQPTILNPFPTIAVWAAIKFVYRKEISSHGSLERKFAFLPLICDPENQEKQSLFHHLNIDDVDYAAGNHPPMFTCVMRNTGTPRLLECHAFVCGNAEDAIVIAATLYQALLRNMKTVEQKRPSVAQNPPPLPPPNKPVSTQHPTSGNRNEEQQYSPASSTSGWSEVLSDGEGHPIRPPRRKKGKSRTYNNDSDTDGASIERRKSLRSSTRSTRSRSSMRSNLRKSMRHSQRTRERIKRTISERQLGNILTEPGDILTKVAIPRSKSFMNVPQNYTVDEIFEEIRVKENISSVDDVLKLIVNREGMSFNDLKPAYKELLLKLAFTMSKDEMYLRSKSIMKGQQLPKVKSTLRRDQSPLGQENTGSSGSKFGSVLKATKKSLSKWGHNRDKKSKSSNKKLTKTQTTLSTATSSSDSLGTSKSKVVTSPIISHAMDCGCVGNQSCVLCAHKAGSKVAPKTPMPARNGRGPAMTCNDCGYDSETCYSEKCYCSLPRGSHSNNHSHHISKQSVCNCDADESCAESEKCYCSLQRLKPNGVKVYNINLDSDTDASQSSSVQLKPASYQQQGNRQQQTRHSSITSWASLSGAESPMTAWRRNTRNFSAENSSQLRSKSSSSSQFSDDVIRPKTSFSQNPELLRQKSSSTMGESVSGLSSTSTSTSFLLSAMRQTNQNGFNSRLEDTDTSESTLSTPSHRRPRSYSTDNLSMTESAFRRLNSESSSDTASRSSGDSIKTTRSAESNQKRVLVVSAVDQRGKIVYRGSQRGGPAQNSLSMKKTTEIAALFSNLKLDQTTDIIENLETASECSIDDAYSTMKNPHAFSDNNLENSLGYLP